MQNEITQSSVCFHILMVDIVCCGHVCVCAHCGQDFMEQHFCLTANPASGEHTHAQLTLAQPFKRMTLEAGMETGITLLRNPPPTPTFSFKLLPPSYSPFSNHIHSDGLYLFVTNSDKSLGFVSFLKWCTWCTADLP